MRTLTLFLSMALLALAADEERMRQLASQLGANDAAARDEAQRELERLATAPEQALKAELAQTKDPELRTRLEGLLSAIKDERALFEAIPPELVADLSPWVHAFHAEWATHQQDATECRCAFDSVRTLATRGSSAVGVLERVVARVRTSIESKGGWTSYPPLGGGVTPGLLEALVPSAASKDAPGLDELGPFYASLITGALKSPFQSNDLLRAFTAQRSLGAGTALLAWVHSTRAALRGEMTGGCTGDAAPLYNDLMSVQRGLEENGDRRLVPLLVELLDADDQSQSFAHIEGSFTVPSATHLAIDVLRKITAQELPYDGLEPDRAKRTEAIAAWRAWYEAHKAEFTK